MRAYSLDIRKKIVTAHLVEKMSIRKVATRFSVSKSLVQKLVKQQQTEGDLQPKQRIEAGIFCDSLELAQILDSISTNPPLRSKLQQRFQDEQQAILYAIYLVEHYGEDQSNGSRTYTAPEQSYRILSSGGDLEVTALDSPHYLIRRDRNNLISSNLRPGDVDNLKALIEFETKSKTSSSAKSKERKSTPRPGSKG